MPTYNTPKIVLNDGTILEGSQCGYSDQKLWCFLKDINFAQAFAMFYTNPAKTMKIEFLYGVNRDVYTGFTDLNIIKKSDATVDVRLTGINTNVQHLMINREEEESEDELDDAGSESAAGTDTAGAE